MNRGPDTDQCSLQDALKQAESTLKEHAKAPGYVLWTLEV
jgi:hypothetical protein